MDAAREGLQQQIYVAVRRAILDGVIASGTRLPSSRTLAEDLLRVAHDDAAGVRAIDGGRVSRTRVTVRARSSPTSFPTISPTTASRRVRADEASATVAPRRGARRDSRAGATTRRTAASRFALGVPGLDLFPLAAVVAARHPASAIDHDGAARLQRFRRFSRAARGDRRPCADGARHARARADQVFIVAGAQRGIRR